MFTLPFYLGWDKEKLDKLILCCHHEYNHGLFRNIKIDLTLEKPLHANTIDDLFGEWCSLFLKLYEYENSNIADYIQSIKLLLPEIIKFKNILTREWSHPYKMPLSQDKICSQMTEILDQICFLLQSLDSYNIKRKEIGLEPVDKIPDIKVWKEVYVLN